MSNSAREEIATTRRLSRTEDASWAFCVSSWGGMSMSVRRSGSHPNAPGAPGLRRELFVEDALLQVVFRVEQQPHRVSPRLLDLHATHVANLVEVRRGADRALVRIARGEAHPCGM